LSGTEMTIRPYLPSDESAVIELWRQCDLLRPWNNPKRDIERKLKVNPELFLVGLIDNKVIATVIEAMKDTEAGYITWPSTRTIAAEAWADRLWQPSRARY